MRALNTDDIVPLAEALPDLIAVASQASDFVQNWLEEDPRVPPDTRALARIGLTFHAEGDLLDLLAETERTHRAARHALETLGATPTPALTADVASPLLALQRLARRMRRLAGGA